MAWNEPGNNDKDNDPWGGGGRRGGGGGDQGPPDIDEVIKNISKKINGLFGGRGGRSSGGGGGSAGRGGGISFGLIIGLVVAAVAIWAFAGFYTIEQAERGVVLRFGKIREAVIMPGLRWNPPFVDEVTKVNIQELNQASYTNDMLTTDENILNLSVAVQYRISDPIKYVIAVQDPELSLDNSAESAIRHVIGGNYMDQILTTGRDAVATEVQERLQNYMDSYTTGIVVSQVNVVEAQPPDAVRPAFDDVIRAREDEQRAQNEAQQFSNRIIPEARGNAQQQIEEANAYKEQVIARAEGEASRFEQLLTEYKKAPEVTRQRLYIEAIQEVMIASSKILVDVEGGNNMLYLPLDKLMEQNANTSVNRDNRTTRELQDLANDLAPYIRSSTTSNSVVDGSRLNSSGRGR